MDGLTSIVVRNVRSIVDVRVDLGGLTVLVGRNGSGKSTLIESCAVLSRLASTEFARDLYDIHGPPSLLARDASLPIEIGCTVSGDLEYRAVLGQRGSAIQFQDEWVRVGGARVFDRDQWADEAVPIAGPAPGQSMIPQALAAQDSAVATRLSAALDAIEVHLQLDTLARWGGRSAGHAREGMRDAQTLGRTSRLALLGQNLANVYYRLRNELPDDHWAETLETVQLGLGHEVSSVLVPTYGPGQIGLELKLRGSDVSISADKLSDGMLAWLAVVAMVRLPHDGGVLVWDEPELHLEPRLLARVVDLLEEHALERPVLVATHSDRFLDFLRDPAGSIVVCDLDASWSTQLFRPDRAALEDWLSEFSGYGALRAAGHDVSLLEPVS